MKTPTCPICGYILKEDFEKDMADGAAKQAASSEALLTHFQRVHPDFWQWEQSKRRLGVGLGIITATVVGVSLFAVFLVFHINGSGFGRGVAGLCTIAFFVPFALISRRGAEEYKARWLAAGKLPTPTPKVALESQNVTEADDFSILSLTNDLARNLPKALDMPDFSVNQLLWKSTIARGNSVGLIPPDIPLFRESSMYLAENMQGKLSLAEWKPLISSALNYQKLGDRKTVWVLAITFPIIAMYAISWFLIPPLFPTTTSCANGLCAVNNVSWIILIILGSIIPIALVVFFALTWQRFRFIADKQTVDSFGKEQLERSLQRVLDVSSPNPSFARKRLDKLASSQS